MASYLPFIPSDPNYQFQCSLDDQTYTFDVRWNNRDQAWYFDMLDSDGKAIILGVKIVLGTFLGRKSAHPFFSNNVLVAIDSTLTNQDATLDDLGTRVFVKHMTLPEYVGSVLYVEG